MGRKGKDEAQAVRELSTPSFVLTTGGAEGATWWENRNVELAANVTMPTALSNAAIFGGKRSPLTTPRELHVGLKKINSTTDSDSTFDQHPTRVLVACETSSNCAEDSSESSVVSSTSTPPHALSEMPSSDNDEALPSSLSVQHSSPSVEESATMVEVESTSNEFETEVDRMARERYEKFLADKAEEEAKAAALSRAVEAKFQALVAGLENRTAVVGDRAGESNCENGSPKSPSSRRLLDGDVNVMMNREVSTPQKVRISFRLNSQKFFR